MTKLALRDVFGGYGKMRVVNGVTLEVNEGEVVAVLGANGSGKSTLLKTILNLASLHSGSIEWKGEDISNLPTWQRVRRGLGYLPQGHVVFPSLTATENMALAAKRASWHPAPPDLTRVHDLFPLLTRLGSVLAGKLSGGERRMLAFACTLLQKPEMLILDEPTGDLAPVAIDRMFEAITRVKEEDRWPILLVEQNVARAMTLADRVCVLRRGTILLDRPAASISEADLVSAFMEHARGVPKDIAGWMASDD
jgi:ABC-type branched-subunit amino acid transport system ATPase component